MKNTNEMIQETMALARRVANGEAHPAVGLAVAKMHNNVVNTLRLHLDAATKANNMVVINKIAVGDTESFQDSAAPVAAAA